jgi:E3 Ubiquitin ligase
MSIWIFAIAGTLLIIAAITCLVFAFGLDTRLAAMQATRTVSSAEVLHLYQSGAQGTRLEVAGVVECDSPLSSPLSNTLCVAYSHQQVRHIEQGVHSSFEEQSRYQRRNNRTEVDPPDDRRVRFYVRDQNGRTLIDPAWASMDMPRSEERYDAFTSGIDTRNVANTGTWHTEDVLAVGSQVYVLGYLGEIYGEAGLARHPHDQAKPFVISYRNEHQLSRSAGSRSSLLFLGAGFAGVFGMLLIAMVVRLFV